MGQHLPRCIVSFIRDIASPLERRSLRAVLYFILLGHVLDEVKGSYVSSLRNFCAPLQWNVSRKGRNNVKNNPHYCSKESKSWVDRTCSRSPKFRLSIYVVGAVVGGAGGGASEEFCAGEKGGVATFCGV